MRTLLLIISLISFTACSTDSSNAGGAASGGGGKNAQAGGGGGSGGGSGDVDAIPGDGSETEGNVSTTGRCSGSHVQPPEGPGLGLNMDTALSSLNGTWKAGLTPWQQSCLEAAKLGVSGNVDAVAQLADGDLKEWATLVAAAQNGGGGNKQEVAEANLTITELTEPRNLTLTFSDGTVSMSGQENFSGSVSVVAVDGDKVTIQMTGEKSEQKDIYFSGPNSIFVAMDGGGGTAFVKSAQ